MTLLPSLRIPRDPTSWRRSTRAALVALLVLGITACGSEDPCRHTVRMRGHILEVPHGRLVLCVGEKGAVQVGQVLEAFSQRRVTGSDNPAGPRYRRERSGTVRITSLFDEHYATAEIVTGTPGIHDTVALPEP
jgi:hypothetical protein